MRTSRSRAAAHQSCGPQHRLPQQLLQGDGDLARMRRLPCVLRAAAAALHTPITPVAGTAADAEARYGTEGDSNESIAQRAACQRRPVCELTVVRAGQ